MYKENGCFSCENDKDFRPKAFPNSSLALGRNHLILLYSWCSVDVQLLFSCCPVNHWTTSVEPLCFYCTEIEPTPLVHPCYLLATLWELRRYTFPASHRSIKVLQYYRLQFQYFRFQFAFWKSGCGYGYRIQFCVQYSVFSFSEEIFFDGRWQFTFWIVLLNFYIVLII